MLYTWCDLYAGQLRSGDDYKEIKPVVSIWLLSETMFPELKDFHLCFSMFDNLHQLSFPGTGSLHLLETGKWNQAAVENDLDRWTLFFRDAEDFDDKILPENMNTLEIKQAMSTLKMFSEKEKAYHLYQARVNYLREQKTIQRGLEEARMSEKAALKREKAALKEIEELKKQLAKAEGSTKN